MSFTCEKCATEGYLLVWGGGSSEFGAHASVVCDGSTVNVLTNDVGGGLWPEGLYNARVDLLTSPYGYCAACPPYYSQIGVDLTPPTIIGCPEAISIDLDLGEAEAAVTWIEPVADDFMSGLFSFSRSHAPGESFPVGVTTVTYTATDVAGNISSCSFDVTVNAACAIISPMGVAGFLDRGWPEGEEPPVVGELEVAGLYEVGEPITGCFSICTIAGEPITAPTILTFYSVLDIGEDFDVRLPLDARYLYFDPGAGTYCFTIDTGDLTPGYHDIRLGFPDGQVVWLRVELIAPPPA